MRCASGVPRALIMGAEDEDGFRRARAFNNRADGARMPMAHV
jgi:hypothetical protein